MEILKRKKKNDIFLISAQNIGREDSIEPPLQDSSIGYRQHMVLSWYNKNIVYPLKLQFFCIKVGLKGDKIIKGYLRNDIDIFVDKLCSKMNFYVICYRFYANVFFRLLKSRWVIGV